MKGDEEALFLRSKHQVYPRERVVSSRGPVTVSQVIDFIKFGDVNWDEADLSKTVRELNVKIFSEAFDQITNVFQFGGVLLVSGIILSLEQINPSRVLLSHLGKEGAYYGKIRDLRRNYGEPSDLLNFENATQTYLLGHNMQQHIEQASDTIGGSPRYTLLLPDKEIPLYDAARGIKLYCKNMLKEKGTPNAIGGDTMANAILHSLMLSGMSKYET